MSYTKVIFLFLSVWVVWGIRITVCEQNSSILQNCSPDDPNKECKAILYDSTISGKKIVNESVSHHIHDQTWIPRASSESIFDLIPDISRYESSISQIKNPICRRDVNIVVDRIRRLDMWALKMLDSSGKTPSGLLNGNVNQFGDFDQCLSIRSETQDTIMDISDDVITGKYCLAYLDVNLVNNHEVNELLHSHGALTSNMSDPGHRIARFSTVSWAFCIPTTCTAQDLETWIVNTWANNSDLSIKVKVEEEMCYTQDREPYTVGKILAFTCFFAILSMTAIGTFFIKDKNINMKADTKESTAIQLLRAFSLQKNLTTLFKTTTPDDDIKCLHGIRALNAIALLLFHKSAATMFNPYVNRTSMADTLGMAWSVIGRTAIIYTDSFILISGMLTSYILVKDLDKKGKISLKEKYRTRFFRITPNLVAVILFCTYVMVDLGSGPQWNLVVKHHSDLCKSNMWRNLLFIHNYFGFENMCLTHTHQLGIDMQLFIVSPFIVWLLWRHLKTGLTVVVTLGALSTILRYTVAFEKQLSPVLYFGSTVTQMFDTANYSYILPSHRATVYLMGILVGFALRRSSKINLNKIQVTLIYVLAISLGLYAMCGSYHMARKGYEYSAVEAANWNAYGPIMWSVFLCLGVFLCTNGNGGFINDFLSWRGFVVFTRIAYGVYLTQFPVFFYNVGSQRTPEFYTSFMLANFAEWIVILAASVALTLLVDLPFQQIKNITWREQPQERITNDDVQVPSDKENALDIGNHLLIQKQGGLIQRGNHRTPTG